MTLRRILSAALLLAAPSAIAAPASGQELSLSLGRRIGSTDAHLSLSVGPGRSGVHAGVRPSAYRGYRESRGYGGYGYRPHRPVRTWVPGRYETVRRAVWVPGRTERVWVEPLYETRRDDCGVHVRVLIRAGHWQEVRHPGHEEVRHVRVWRPGYWTHR